MTHGIRRVITTHDADGKAVIASDGPAPNVRRREASGITSTPTTRRFSFCHSGRTPSRASTSATSSPWVRMALVPQAVMPTVSG